MSFSNRTVFHTCNDGILRASRLSKPGRSPSLEQLHEVATLTEKKLAFCRIYSINVLHSPDQQLVMARYEHGFAYAKLLFDEEKEGATAGACFELVASFPAANGAAAQIFNGGAGNTVMLDLDGHVTWMDLAAGGGQCGITGRRRLAEDFHIGRFGWGSLAPGPGPEVITVAGRKAVGLFDRRVGTTVRRIYQLGAKEYVRCVAGTESSSHDLLVASDSRVCLWDLRNIGDQETLDAPPQVNLPTGFGKESVVQVTRHFAHPARSQTDWLLSVSQFGDLSLAALDWHHNSCGSSDLESVDESIKMRCLAQERRRPNVLGPTRVIDSWRDTVLRGRSLGGHWLEPSMERR